jgi:capsular polysaccharide biosynthesis protein
VWERQPSETQVDYALPSTASEELIEYFRPLSSVIFAPDGIARLPGGRVFGPGIVLSADGQALARDVSVDFGKSFQEHWLLGFERIKPPLVLSGRTAVVATALARGYSHWLLDELPRLLLIREVGYESLIAHSQQPFVQEALTLLSLTARIIEPARYSHFQCEQLIVPSMIGQPGYPTADTVRLIEEFTQQHGRADLVCGEKIYLSREKARRRRIVNEAELWPWLQARGFVKICAEDLTWSEQIEVWQTSCFAHLERRWLNCSTALT